MSGLDKATMELIAKAMQKREREKGRAEVPPPPLPGQAAKASFAGGLAGATSAALDTIALAGAGSVPSAPPAGATVPPDALFLASLPTNRNLYFLSRIVPPSHHVSVDFTVDGAPQRALFVGPSLFALKRAPTMVRGPCCNVVLPPEAVVPAPESMPSSAHAAVVANLEASEAGVVVVMAVTPHGMFGSCTVTEFIARGGQDGSVQDQLVADVHRDLATPTLSALDRLDSELMLGILGDGTSPHKPPGGSPPPRAPATGDILVAAATAVVFLDAVGNTLTDACHPHSFHTSLKDLGPREASPWLNIVPEVQGTLWLPHTGPEHAHICRAVVSAAADTWLASVRSTYSSPLSHLRFLHGEELLPPIWRETRPCTVSVRLRPATSLPDDIQRAENAADVACARLLLDAHAAFHAAPFRVSHEWPDLGLAASVELEFAADGSSTVRLAVNDRCSEARAVKSAPCGLAPGVVDGGGVLLGGAALLSSGSRLGVPCAVPAAAVTDGVRSVYVDEPPETVPAEVVVHGGQ